MGCVGDECAWDKCLTFKCSQVLWRCCYSLQVHHAANGRDTSVHSIVSLAGVVRLAVALCPQNITLSRASSPAFG